MKQIERIIQNIKDENSGYSPYEFFSDWVKSCSIAISNACTLFPDEDWEIEYLSIIRKYNRRDQERFSEILGLLCEAYEKEIRDVLGEIFMSQELGNSRVGQFFTPFHISELTAKIALDKAGEPKKYRVIEPSSGSGGMIIAAAKILKEQGVNYQKDMIVTAQDLDWRAVYMTYVQLSLLGIDAIVVQGDSLKSSLENINLEEMDSHQILLTPRRAGTLI